MYGAIIGDIAGSTYERRNIKTKNFELFRLGSRCTDDTSSLRKCLWNITLLQRQDVPDSQWLMCFGVSSRTVASWSWV